MVPTPGTFAVTIDALRDNDRLPSRTFPGCYSILYMDESPFNYGVLCPTCAAQELRDGTSEELTPFVRWEGAAIQCDGCGTDIESEYGDPWCDMV